MNEWISGGKAGGIQVLKLLLFNDQKRKTEILYYFIILTQKEAEILPISQLSLQRQGD